MKRPYVLLMVILIAVALTAGGLSASAQQEPTTSGGFVSALQADDKDASEIVGGVLNGIGNISGSVTDILGSFAENAGNIDFDAIGENLSGGLDLGGIVEGIQSGDGLLGGIFGENSDGLSGGLANALEGLNGALGDAGSSGAGSSALGILSGLASMDGLGNLGSILGGTLGGNTQQTTLAPVTYPTQQYTTSYVYSYSYQNNSYETYPPAVTVADTATYVFDTVSLPTETMSEIASTTLPSTSPVAIIPGETEGTVSGGASVSVKKVVGIAIVFLSFGAIAAIVIKRSM